MSSKARYSWRSWFWNLFLATCMLIMAALVTAVAVAQSRMSGRTVAAVGFGVVALLCWVAVVRSLFIGVSARPDAIVMRGFVRTVTVPWDEVVDIEVGPLRSGAAGAAGADASFIVRRPPGKAPRRVELNVLGGYGLIRRHPTPAERATSGLRVALDEWRAEHPGQQG